MHLGPEELAAFAQLLSAAAALIASCRKRQPTGCSAPSDGFAKLALRSPARSVRIWFASRLTAFRRPVVEADLSERPIALTGRF